MNINESTARQISAGEKQPRHLVSALIGGILGYVAALAIAVNNLYTPVIPVLSIELIGLGTVIV